MSVVEDDTFASAGVKRWVPAESEPGARTSVGYLNVRVNDTLNEVHHKQRLLTLKGRLLDSVTSIITGAGLGGLMVAMNSYWNKALVTRGKLAAGTAVGATLLGGLKFMSTTDPKFSVDVHDSIFHLQQLNDARNLLNDSYGKDFVEPPVGESRYQEIKNDPLLTGPRISSGRVDFSDREYHADREFAKKHAKRDPLVADGTSIGKSQ